jgi:hypothetical protein
MTRPLASATSLLRWALLATLASATGCSADCLSAPDTQADQPTPLQPLVYTETADSSPGAAAARERRLLRQLRTGAQQQGSWGGLGQANSDLPAMTSADRLGEALGRALFKRDEALWSHVFVPAAAYGKLVNLKPAAARRFVDEQRGGSRDVWRAFQIETQSKLPPDGFSSVFSTGNLNLGDPRTLDGDRAGDDQRPIQYWNNRLILGRPDSNIQFAVHIPKIIRIPPALSTRGQPRFGIAGDIELGEKLEVFLDAGLHFSADVLSAADYPFPLNVGNFWKYRRTIEADPRAGEDAPDDSPQSTLLVEVMEVDRFRSWRVVHLRSIHLNQRGSRRDIRWLLTPRRIFACDSTCRHYADDLDRLLTYIARHTPIFAFPITLGDTWGDTHRSMRTSSAFETIENEAGKFSGTIPITGTAAGADWTLAQTATSATRWFAPRTGIVKRRVTIPSSGTGGTSLVTDTLTEYRLMER